MHSLTYKGYIYRQLRTAAKLVMYHGTCTGPNNEVLSSILKEGLKPDPKEKAYKSPYPEDEEAFYELDLETETSMRLDESLGGAYLTNSLGEAVKYAKHACQEGGGHPMLVAAQIETRTPEVKIDEDFLINYSWEYIIKHFRAKDDDSYYLELYEWLTEGDADWDSIAKGWIEQQFSHTKISELRWRQILPKAADMLRDIAIVTFLQKYEQEAHNEAMKQDDYWEVDVFYEITNHLESYKENIQFVTEKLKEITEPPKTGQHNIRILKPVGYRGANRVLAVVSWQNGRYPTLDPGTYAQIGKVYYAYSSAAVETLLDAVRAKYSKWTDNKGNVIYDQSIPPQQMSLPTIAKTIRYNGATYRVASADDYYYHITYVGSLPAVAARGLQPGTGINFGKGYSGHSAGKLFLADWDGVGFWVDRLGQMAENRSDTPVQDGLIPVVLRFPEDPNIEVDEDIPGTKDSSAGAWTTSQPIPSNKLEVYDGATWLPISSIDHQELIDEAYEAAEKEFEDDEELVYLNASQFEPAFS
jgi:hypothetical protein